jgi:hypothetical protein
MLRKPCLDAPGLCRLVHEHPTTLGPFRRLATAAGRDVGGPGCSRQPVRGNHLVRRRLAC